MSEKLKYLLELAGTMNGTSEISEANDHTAIFEETIVYDGSVDSFRAFSVGFFNLPQD